ncbi:hypothetical protein QJS10_CPB12g01042 [Acorus calamus]|uniref:Uncharacterized protein n=1 Tax=Acorus calamus TaxID=4465 RepID=A0AAV9DME3_ACOCL|nr:hypothetical protein QJS10_CPB12g01042 [Acorus calamus]
MAAVQSSGLQSLHLPPLIFSATPSRTPTSVSLTSIARPPSLRRRHRRLPPPRALRASAKADDDILRSVVESGGGGRERGFLPAVRTYENDLARVLLVGDVAADQAVTAAAADGGETAGEHIASGLPTMVVETVFPGSNADERSTVSTRLFLPANKVKEKASKLRSRLSADVLSSTSSKNVLAMTFRQVVLRRLWSFDLTVFHVGTERDMGDLANTREVPMFFTVSSSDRRVLSVLAEAVCACALECAKNDFDASVGVGSPSNIFHWFKKLRRIASNDSSVCIYVISEDEMVRNARNLVEKFRPFKGRFEHGEMEMKQRWWQSPNRSRLNKVVGPEIAAWVDEYVPAYRIQLDADKFKDVKFKCWEKTSDNRWEVLLTHFQMVGLANILDMYYEDYYTIPDKQLSCSLTSEISTLSRFKSSSWITPFVTLIGGGVLLSVAVLAQLCWPNLWKPKLSSLQHHEISVSDSNFSHTQLVEVAELEAMCTSVVKKIKDTLDWPGDLMDDPRIGAWAGELPGHLGVGGINVAEGVNGEATEAFASDVSAHGEVSGNATSQSEKNDTGMQMPNAQDIATYQVVMAIDGRVIGFQPTNRIAVNHWAGNPLAKVLYEGRKLSPGILETSLKIPLPKKIVLIELLMSANPESRFVLARPIQSP